MVIGVEHYQEIRQRCCSVGAKTRYISSPVLNKETLAFIKACLDEDEQERMAMEYESERNTEVKDIEYLRRRKCVRWREGCELYSMGMCAFQTLAYEAGAVYHIPMLPPLVNCEKFEEYPEKYNR